MWELNNLEVDVNSGSHYGIPRSSMLELGLCFFMEFFPVLTQILKSMYNEKHCTKHQHLVPQLTSQIPNNVMWLTNCLCVGATTDHYMASACTNHERVAWFENVSTLPILSQPMSILQFIRIISHVLLICSYFRGVRSLSACFWTRREDFFLHVAI